MAFNLGRPALTAGEETIRHGREFLEHPLSKQTDSRLVASCELLSARGKCRHHFILQDYTLSTSTFSRGEPQYHGLSIAGPVNKCAADTQQYGCISHSLLPHINWPSRISMRNSSNMRNRQKNGSSIGTSIMKIEGLAKSSFYVNPVSDNKLFRVFELADLKHSGHWSKWSRVYLQ